MLYSPSPTTGVVTEGAGGRPARTAADPFRENRFAGLVADDAAEIPAAPLLQPRAAAGRPDNAIRNDALPPTAEALGDGAGNGLSVDDLRLGDPEEDALQQDDPSDSAIPILANRDRRAPTEAPGFGLDVSERRADAPDALGHAVSQTEALGDAVSGAGQPAPVLPLHEQAAGIDADAANPAAFCGRRAESRSAGDNPSADDGWPFSADRTVSRRAPIAGNPHRPVDQLPTRQTDVPARTDAPAVAPAVAIEPGTGDLPGGLPIATGNAAIVESALPAPPPATMTRLAEPMAQGRKDTPSVTTPPPAPAATDATSAPRLVDPLSLGVAQPLPADRSVVPSTATFPAHFARAGPAPASVRELPVSLSKAVADGKTDLTLALRPAELGQLTIRLQFVDGQLQVEVRADRPETLQLLQREAEGFERSLRQAGLDLRDGGLQFSAHGDGGRQRPSAGGQIWHGLAREGHEQPHTGGSARRPGDERALPARTIGLAGADRLDLRI